MTLSRTIAWTTSISEIRAAGRPALPVYVVAGKFDCRAIMQAAVSIARRFGSSCQLDWQGRMRLGLRTAWKRANVEEEIAAGFDFRRHARDEREAGL